MQSDLKGSDDEDIFLSEEEDDFKINKKCPEEVIPEKTNDNIKVNENVNNNTNVIKSEKTNRARKSGLKVKPEEAEHSDE